MFTSNRALPQPKVFLKSFSMKFFRKKSFRYSFAEKGNPCQECKMYLILLFAADSHCDVFIYI